MHLTMQVNGRDEQMVVAEDETLLAALRDRLRLTGTKEGCSEGECGACTVLVDGLAVDACLYAAGAAAGRTIMTIEGLATNGLLTDLQTALLEHGGVQCGFCTPGLLMMLSSMLASMDNESVTEAVVRESIAGNICRCTGYAQVVDAVLDVVSQRAGVVL
jgi:aerobic-type carbon monoxide dehydrogenase small subunit (CoxS/CutS family)